MIFKFKLMSKQVNNLYMRCTTSRTEFKRELKTHLFSPYE